MRSVAKLALLAALLGGAAAPRSVSAQGLTTGVLRGEIQDRSGQPLGNVSVMLTHVGSGRQILIQAPRSGMFTSGFLTPGRYDALFERLGYTPVRIQGIQVDAGESRNVTVRLVQAEGPVLNADVRQAALASAGSSDAAPTGWLTARGAAALPFEGLGLDAVALLSTRAGPSLDVQGLPPWLTTVVIDGVPAAPLPWPGRFSLARNLGLSLSSFGSAELVTAAPDVEWIGSAGGYVSALTRQAGASLGGSAAGDWGGDALASASDAAPFQNYRASAQVGGPIVPDTAHFVIGAEILNAETPFRSLWVPDEATAGLVGLASQNEVDLGRYAEPTIGSLERFSAFGRLDLRVGDDHDFSVRATGAVVSRISPILPRTGLLLGPGASPEARELLANANFTSRLDDDVLNDASVGFELSRFTREPGAGAEPDALDLPTTVVAGVGHEFGWPDAVPTSAQMLSLYLRETLQHQAGNHLFKYGVIGQFPSYELSYERGNAGEFFFASTEDLAQRRGAFRRFEGTVPSADLGFRRWSFYVQDTWTPVSDVELLAGVRYSFTRMPDTTDLSLNSDWFDLTALTNRSLPSNPGGWEPRVALRWRPGGGDRFELGGMVLVDSDLVDPGLFAEVFSNAGGFDVFYGVGDLGRWPAAPDTLVAANQGPALTLLGPNFRGPQTTRARVNLASSLGSIAGLTLSGDLRRTDFLPQRRDVNRLTTPTASDQHGRPVYGRLVKIGGLVASEPGTSRRLVEFDRVWAIESAAYSVYRGLTVTLQRPLLDGVGLLASYTHSYTEDNWLLGNSRDPEAQISPFADTLGLGEWAEGTSDLDVPHRFLLGTEIQVPGSFGPRLAALYRFQSGYPFTPGFRDGVDVNGDGSARNDPAFIDPAVPGMSDLTAAWPCLRTSLNAFVERNACRSPNVHGLDARLTVNFLSDERYGAQLVVDGLNLVSSDAGLVDSAVYLIDPNAVLGGNQDAGSVTIPLIVNPGFGELRTRFAPQRMIRLGLRITY